MKHLLTFILLCASTGLFAQAVATDTLKVRNAAGNYKLISIQNILDLTAGGGGDITAVGNVTSGAAFTGADTGNDLFFEGATVDGFEIKLTSDDPSADFTVTLPSATGYTILSLTSPASANSVSGIANGFEFEGATLNASETQLVVTDPTADRTITVPDASGTITLLEVAQTFTALKTFGAGATITTGQTFTVNGDAITDMTGTGITLVSNALTASLGTSVDLTTEITGTLPVANGGTGATTFTSAALLIGNGTSAVSSLALGSTDQILAINDAGNAHNYRTLSTGTTGSDFNIAAVDGTITWHLPDASASNRGAMTTSAQTFAGLKTFGAGLIATGIGSVAAIDLNGTLKAKGSNLTATSVTLDATHGSFIFVNATANAVTLNLPALSENKVYFIKRRDCTGNTVTLDPNSTETFEDGSSTKTITCDLGILIVASSIGWVTYDL